MGLPRARMQNMIVEKLPDETLVCDPDRNCAHSLRPLAAAIWPRCDGATSPAELAAMASRAGIDADEGLVALALDELARAELVAGWERGRRPAGVPRRALLQSVVALVGVVTIMAPAVGATGD
jgi:coenzyme PQQ synthesis protein D (PqqD)